MDKRWTLQRIETNEVNWLPFVRKKPSSLPPFIFLLLATIGGHPLTKSVGLIVLSIHFNFALRLPFVLQETCGKLVAVAVASSDTTNVVLNPKFTSILMGIYWKSVHLTSSKLRQRKM